MLGISTLNTTYIQYVVILDLFWVFFNFRQVGGAFVVPSSPEDQCLDTE